VESTLSSNIARRWIERANECGYQTILIYYYLSSALLAVRRVAKRVLRGGHFVDRETIFRRYKESLRQLSKFYLSAVEVFMIFDNSKSSRLIASKSHAIIDVTDEKLYHKLSKGT
jgi:predicted ABC-type ATPase